MKNTAKNARLNCLAFLVLMGSTGNADIVMTLEAPGIGTSQVPGVVVEDFDSFPLGPLGTPNTAIGPFVSASPDVTVQTANLYGGAGGTGNHLLAYGNTAEISFDTPQGYFGLWWSGMDRSFGLPYPFGNTVTINTANGDTFWLDFLMISNSRVLTPEHFGNPFEPFRGQASWEPFAFVNFFATDDGSKITSVSLGGGNFESDNLSILGELTSVRGTVIRLCPDPIFACFFPPRGDFNRDKVVDRMDIDQLGRRISVERYHHKFDLNGDQLLNQDDLTTLLGGNFITDGNKLNGDADFDGTVTFADFLILSSNFGQRRFGQPPKKWSEGDFIADGQIEFDDFLVLSANFGQTAGSVTQVPEPSTSLLTAFGILGLLGCRRRSR